MTEIILKDDLEQDKLDALVSLLKSWNINAEFRTTENKESKTSTDFSIAEGIWSDREIDGEDLSNQAWKK